ncbi:NUDIX domain-containing protein [Streptomyces lavendulae]|uniref:NUDIX domain-containing protein n=1 Tax=Streptomyces lavendulae TaxID=1914 RepID=UPI00340BA54F
MRDANKPHICDPGTWSIPGGDREGEETSREAVERELLEETGLSVPLEPFTVVDAHGPDGGTGQICVLLVTTMCPWTADVIALHERTAPVPAPRPESLPAQPGGASRA